MKKIIYVTLALFLSLSSFSQTKISIDSVSKYMGQNVTVCSKVYGVKSLEKVTLINLGASYHNSPLTIVIFAKDKDNFKDSVESMYDDKNVCVTGTLKEYNGRPEIVVAKPAALTVQ